MPITVSGISAILADGVRETTQTTGTGTYSLDGAATVEGITYRTFVAGVGSGNATVYVVRAGSQFEIGIGTVTSGAPATLTRSVILKSSSSNNAVSWGVGVKDIIIDCPSDVLHSLQGQLDNALTRVKTTTITASGTFTPDSDMLFCHVRIVGGGGAGGGTPATSTFGSAGGGGGGGEYAEGWFTAAQIGASKAVTIGAGGVGVSAAQGNAGGTTSLATLLTAVGGSGGSVGVHTSSSEAFGGIGGTGGTGGHLRVPGSAGYAGGVRDSLFLPLGGGGSSLLGFALYGGGGAGRFIGFPSGALAGISGSPGVCTIVEYCKA